ncbi:conserved hypothetical protein [Anaeromyxobacter dehalogenans 2CP-1]|uniref:Lipoprotein n=1 Tax=Anaeromyxobacter dehalogenans (strain ATCC BAA-258 / DSM 21875 / 2CP-1) TaxID=455488 RepID=B8JER0_ANAD2|nr:hypothetical protein [Anaeromyxobacter dehalogenans]ACL66206.1 conserved hypothetical protein [Anaeromyxobacter dehalogenans 2CP-1]
MRLVWLSTAFLLALGPVSATARPWKGVTPGVTAQAEVVGKFGEPTARTRRGARTVLAYYGDQALEGTKQAQFHLDPAGTVQEITIFLTVPLDADTIEGTYGKPTQKTFVEDTFQKVWLYPAQGVTVYFAKDGSVEALSFAAGRQKAAPAAARPAAAEAAAAR